MKLWFLSMVVGGGIWAEGVNSISPANKVVKVEDNANGVVCYVAIAGIATWDIHGISCVKVH